MHHYLNLSSCQHETTHLGNSGSLYAEWVLVDLYYVVVQQEGLGFRLDVAEVDGHEEWCRQDGPYRHLRALLVHAQPIVANNDLPGTRYA